MCGFVVVLTKESSCQENFMKESLFKLKNRGPDQHNFSNHLSNRLWLGHTRLSINDLSNSGMQPMISNNGNAIVFNGEIYNFRKLKQELNSYNLLKGNSDTSVLLALLDQYGVEESLSKINGMFAFSYFNKLEQKISIVTDLFGEKPIYFFSTDEIFIASSQLDVILSHPKCKTNLNHQKVIDYMHYGYIAGEKSIYKNINRLVPSSLLSLNVDNLKFTISNYSRIQYQHSLTKKISPSIQNIKESLIFTLKDQLSCDAKKGLFLSSGTDSSLIASLTSIELGMKIPAFTASFSEAGWDESIAANKIAKKLNLECHNVHIDIETISDYINIQHKIFDEPFSDPAQIASYQISKFAKKEVSVLLGGDGADELFCGYRRIRFAKYLSKINSLKLNIPLGFFSNLIYDILHKGFAFDNQFIYRIEKLKNLLLTETKDSFLKLSSSHPDLSKFLDISMINSPSTIEHNTNTRGIATHIDFMDLSSYLPWNILVKLDRSCMFNGVESRSPFLDKKFAPNILEFTTNQLMGKVHIKKLLSQYLDKEYVYQPKRGFGIPLQKLMKGILLDEINDIMNSSCNDFPYLKINYFKSLLEKSRNSVISHLESIMLWKLLILLKWSRGQKSITKVKE